MYCDLSTIHISGDSFPKKLPASVLKEAKKCTWFEWGNSACINTAALEGLARLFTLCKHIDWISIDGYIDVTDDAMKEDAFPYYKIVPANVDSRVILDLFASRIRQLISSFMCLTQVRYMSLRLQLKEPYPPKRSFLDTLPMANLTWGFAQNNRRPLECRLEVESADEGMSEICERGLSDFNKLVRAPITSIDFQELLNVHLLPRMFDVMAKSLKYYDSTLETFWLCYLAEYAVLEAKESAKIFPVVNRYLPASRGGIPIGHIVCSYLFVPPPAKADVVPAPESKTTHCCRVL